MEVLVKPVKGRNDVVTIAKAICIVLMVIGHSGCPDYLWKFIYLFHMPFFFFISGYFYRADKVLKDGYIMSKVKSLWVPFVKWSIVFLLLHNVFFRIGILDTSFSINDILKKLFLIPFMYGNDELIGGYWFIKDLFYSTMVIILLCKFPFIRKLGDIKISTLFFLCMTIAFGMILAIYSRNHSVIFREICIIVSSASFFSLGYFLANNKYFKRFLIEWTGGVEL